MKHGKRSSTQKRHGLFTAGLVVTMTVAASVAAQEKPDQDADDKLNRNAPPFDFSDAFYRANGINVDELDSAASQRFGLARFMGPPAGPGQHNWVVDKSNTNPDRNNIRILASTGGYKDDTGSPTQFISIIAFLHDRNIFTPANQSGGAGNARGLAMQDIADTFEAYAAPKQVDPDGIFRPTPCASIGDPVEVAKGNCFSVASEATPNLRQDWRFSTNRTAIDGSDGPLLQSYFGDNLLGLWSVTYFWYTAAGFGPKQTPDCKAALDFLAARNGLTLDGTPVIKTGAELHFVEGASALQGNEFRDFPTPPTDACAKEGNLDTGGKDKGAVWLVCPSIPDPTKGGIAPDAFVDTVRRPNGGPLIDPQITASFNCLQKTGQFCKLPTGTYMVKNQNSGLFWDGASGGRGVDLEALNTKPGDSSQQWTFTAKSDGTYSIINKASGLSLTVPRNKSVVQSVGDNDRDDKWMVSPLDNGYRITNAASHLAVDATSETPNPGTSIAQAVPTGETRQVWVIR